jgi:Adenylate and Guanylate cyclase catalytic domain/Double zinc ribbon
MKCPECQHENPPEQKFCGECGARLAAACASCGASNPPRQKFCGECGAALLPETLAKSPSPESYTPKHLAERIINSKAAVEGERKQVTVLFADVKGSMELLADRDPEEARKILDPVLERMMEAVHRYEGTVNQVMGDGIMALFGAPLAHEDHAVRACYAALHMQESVAQYAEAVFRSHGVPLQIRVGLNSGEVVVRAIGSDLHMDYTAVGQTTPLGRPHGADGDARHDPARPCDPATGKREQAREHLATATTMYREMGMTYWLEKAEAEMTKPGGG